MILVTRMAVLQTEQRRETQRHPRVWISVEKRAPLQQPQPDGTGPNTAESMVKTRTVPCKAGQYLVVRGC
jgi:hypothetical protein